MTLGMTFLLALEARAGATLLEPARGRFLDAMNDFEAKMLDNPSHEQEIREQRDRFILDCFVTMNNAIIKKRENKDK